MSSNSITKNAVLNSFRTVMGMILPLFTFPYVSRILLVDNLGKVNFAANIVSYFTLLAGLGIQTYAIREGSYIRYDQRKLEKFISEVLAINIFSTIISYILLWFTVTTIDHFHNYILLISIYSLNIIGNTLSVEWIYTIYENYVFITIKSIVIQLTTMILIFTCIHSSGDYVVYAAISALISLIANIFSFLNIRRKIKFNLIYNSHILMHIRPIMIVFAMTVATTIYVNSDTTMIGIINGDYYVGIYNAATKMYSIIKTLMVSCIIVALPRLSQYRAKNDSNVFNNEAKRIFNYFMTFLLSGVVGVYMTSEEIINIIAGKAYAESIFVLRILSISLLFAVIATYLTNVFLLPMKRERDVMYATIISAILNIILNFVLLPYLKHIGAALTTVISEFFVMMWQLVVLKFKIPFRIQKKNAISVILGCLLIFTYCHLIDVFCLSLVVRFFIKIAGSILLYGFILVAFKHDIYLEIVSKD